mmetsp:Transcript_22367/g.68868  ORF Transcript_22367/g.68868 Transcript_22367/m.68868 type:complete len:173 (+) Transcript_22367:255-773(+)
MSGCYRTVAVFYVLPVFAFQVFFNFVVRFHFDVATVACVCWSLACLCKVVCTELKRSEAGGTTEEEQQKGVLSSTAAAAAAERQRVDDDRGPFVRWLRWVLVGIFVFWVPAHLHVVLTSPLDIQSYFVWYWFGYVASLPSFRICYKLVIGQWRFLACLYALPFRYLWHLAVN